MPTATTSDWPSLRLCTVAKQRQGDEYGFNLHAEKGRGQYIGDIDVDSPADRGGLRKGDRIVAINGHAVTQLPHKEVVQHIKTNPMQCTMLVIDEEGHRWYVENHIELTTDMPNVETIIPGSHRRVEKMTTPTTTGGGQTADKFMQGFEDPFSHPPPVLQLDDVSSLEEEVEQSFEFLDAAEATETTETATLEATETVVATETATIEATETVVATETATMEATETETETATETSTIEATETVVVATESATETTEESAPPSVTRAVQSTLTPPPMMKHDPLPTLCSLVKEKHDDEFGFNLHAEAGKGHFVGKVDEDSIGHYAGLVLGQRIVGVNKTLIFPDSQHQRVVALIRNDPLRTDLLVASEAVDDYYRQNDMSFSFDRCHVYDHDAPPPMVQVVSNARTTVTQDQVQAGNKGRSASSSSSSSSSSSDKSSKSSKFSHKELAVPEMVREEERGVDVVMEQGQRDVNVIVVEGSIAGDEPAEVAPVLTSHTHIQHHQHQHSNGAAHHHHNGNGHHEHHQHHGSNSNSSSNLIPADDMFSMSAAELRSILANKRRKDPKMDNTLTMLQKHEYIENM